MTTPAQAEFDLSVQPDKPREAGLRELLHILKSLGPAGATAKQIGAKLGYSERKVRQLAEASDNTVVSAPGMKGYKHFDHCTPAEIAEASKRLISQSRLMLYRAIRLRRKAHAVIR